MHNPPQLEDRREENELASVLISGGKGALKAFSLAIAVVVVVAAAAVELQLLSPYILET